jgi:uncharacterized protein with gpF-like domain
MLKILKASAAVERQRLEALLERQAAHIRRAFNVFVAASTDAAAMREVRQLIEAGDLDDAIATVDQHLEALANSLARVFVDAGSAEAAAWTGKLGVVVSFDQTAQRAVEIMRRNRLHWLTDFTRDQKQVTRNALVQGVRNGWGAVKVANEFKNSIGLSPYYARMVETYAATLSRGNVVDALSRDLRDRRFDATLNRIAHENDVLSQAQIDMMVSRYRRQVVNHRAEKIARTTALQVMGQAQQESLRQTLEQTGIDPTRVSKTWFATLDKRTRDSHASTSGQTVKLNDAFTVGNSRLRYPGDTSLGATIDQVINCRCVCQITISEPQG